MEVMKRPIFREHASDYQYVHLILDLKSPI